MVVGPGIVHFPSLALVNVVRRCERTAGDIRRAACRHPGCNGGTGIPHGVLRRFCTGIPKGRVLGSTCQVAAQHTDQLRYLLVYLLAF